MNWTPAQLPDLDGRTYAITGGNSGIGLETARILIGKGARVVITARSQAKAEGALADLRQSVADADLDHVLLDLSEPDSIAAALPELIAKTPTLDGIINNAGVMQTPEIRTSEGFELQFATNHLGHFRLNSGLFHHLEASNGRIVPVSSIAHKMGTIQLDDLNSEHSYNKSAAYGQSKLANLMYSFELQRRLTARGSSVVSIAAHPGYSATNLQSAGVGMQGGSTLYRWIYKLTNAVMAQDPANGAYPSALAAAWPDAKAGGYYGPTGMADARGPVGEASIHDKAKDEDVARQLWERTEALVGRFFAEA